MVLSFEIMCKKTNIVLMRLIFAWCVAFFAPKSAVCETGKLQTLYKKVTTDGYSKEWDEIRIEAGSFKQTRQFNVRRISDPSKANWNLYEGHWKAKFEMFPHQPHLANWKGEVLSVWQSVDGSLYFLLDIVKELDGEPFWNFVRSDKIERTPAYFPEAILEEAVSEALGIDSSRLTKKLVSDRLISFELNGAEVRDLTGLGDAKNLEVLTLRDNLITDLSPLSGLHKLRRLELRGNRIKTLEALKSLPALVQLNLSQTR